MNITLKPEQEKFVAEKVESGEYLTPAEVIGDGLELLRNREEAKRRRLEELRQKIDIGLQQIDRGEAVDGETFFAGLLEKNQRRMTGGA